MSRRASGVDANQCRLGIRPQTAVEALDTGIVNGLAWMADAAPCGDYVRIGPVAEIAGCAPRAPSYA